jgi:hypothetical protein
MRSRFAAILVLSGIVVSCTNVGCTKRAEKKDGAGPGPVLHEVIVDQGDSSPLIDVHGAIRIEGEKDGVTASIQDNRFIAVHAAEDAKVGIVLITVKDGTGTKIASLAVSVKEGDIDLKFHVRGPKSVTVTQGAETVIEMPIIRGPRYDIFSPFKTSLVVRGNFQGELKLSSEVAKGGKGLAVKFDPEAVKANERKAKLILKAAEDADLGEAVVRLTATTADLRATASAAVDVNVAAKNK